MKSSVLALSRCALLLLSVLLLLSAVSCAGVEFEIDGAGASVDVYDRDDSLYENDSLPAAEGETVKWTLSEDGTVLCGGLKEYRLYHAPAAFFIDPETVYEYTYGLYLDGFTFVYDDETYICSPYRGAELVWLDGMTGTRLYATKSGAESLNRFFAGTDCRYTLVTDGILYETLDEGTFEALEALRLGGGTAVEYDVTDLASLPSIDLYAFDGTNTVAREVGILFEVGDGAYGYLNYGALTNDHFDANGHFSYRSGTVALTLLGAELNAEIVEEVDEMDYRETVFDYENGSAMPIGLFWFCFVFVGLLLPIPFLVLGLILPHLRGLGKPKYWYGMAALGGLWLLVAVVLMIVLLL